MKRKMTLVFNDEDLYTRLKIEAIKQRTTASEIVSAAVREWLESCEDAALAPLVREAREEYQKKVLGRGKKLKKRWKNTRIRGIRINSVSD